MLSSHQYEAQSLDLRCVCKLQEWFEVGASDGISGNRDVEQHVRPDMVLAALGFLWI